MELLADFLNTCMTQHRRNRKRSVQSWKDSPKRKREKEETPRDQCLRTVRAKT